MVRIVERNNPLNLMDEVVNEAPPSRLIDYLQEKYPKGFSRPSKIFLNNTLLPVEHYDVLLQDRDIVHICLAVEDPVSAIFVAIFSAAYTINSAIEQRNLLNSYLSQVPETDTTSPTYNTRSQSNLARLSEPIPVIYGKNKLYPDLATAPWAEYVDNTQYLNQLFCVGQGYFDIETINLGEINITSLTGLNYVVYEPQEAVTLFHDNMYTSPFMTNADMPTPTKFYRSGTYTFNFTAKTITGSTSDNFKDFISVGDTLQATASTSAPFTTNFGHWTTMTVTNVTESVITVAAGFTDGAGLWPGSGSASGTGTIFNTKSTRIFSNAVSGHLYYPGGTETFLTNPAGTLAQTFYIDILFPEGLYQLSGGNVTTYTATFNLFLNVGTGFNEEVLTATVSAAKKGSFRATLSFTASTNPAGSYSAIIYRSDTHGWNDSNYVTGSSVIGFKAKLPTISIYGNVTLLAIRLQATASIDSNNSKKFNMICTRKLPIWNGSAWSSPTTTQNPTWAIADIWMSTYGGSRSYLNLDLDTLLTLETTWDAKGDTCNAIFDQKTTVWEALEKVARCGRAKPVLVDGMLTIVRDEAKETRTALFNQRNIVKDSFEVTYTFKNDKSPDGVRLKYLDEEANYNESYVNSNDSATRPLELDFFGVTNYEQAWREAQYMAASQNLNVQQVAFSTELEGHLPIIGDLVTVTHDLMAWGQGGEVTSKSGTTITCTEPLTFTPATDHYIGFRKQDGSFSGPHLVTEGLSENQCILAVDVVDFTFITDKTSIERTYYTFGPITNWTKDCLITEINPIDELTIAIKCIPYISEIYGADEGTPPTKPTFDSATSPIPPKLSGLTLTNATSSGDIVATWNPEFNIDSYKVQYSNDNVSWTNFSTPNINTETIAQTGLVYVRVATVIGAVVGDYISNSIVAS